MSFGRARDDHPGPKTGTGTMSTCPSELAMCCKVRHWPSWDPRHYSSWDPRHGSCWNPRHSLLLLRLKTLLLWRPKTLLMLRHKTLFLLRPKTSLFLRPNHGCIFCVETTRVCCLCDSRGAAEKKPNHLSEQGENKLWTVFVFPAGKYLWKSSPGEGQLTLSRLGNFHGISWPGQGKAPNRI